MNIVHHDPTRCNGALACVKACSKTTQKKDDPAYSTIRICDTAGKWQANVCNQCGECILVCPTKALWRNKAGTVLLKKELCVSCFMCVGSCPTRSFHRLDGELHPIKCIACGACAKACPSGAIAMKATDHASLPA